MALRKVLGCNHAIYTARGFIDRHNGKQRGKHVCYRSNESFWQGQSPYSLYKTYEKAHSCPSIRKLHRVQKNVPLIFLL